MEYLALAVILYFILRTMGNLVRLLGGSNDAASGRDARSEAPPQREGWEGPSPRQQTGAAREEPTFWGEDIEDATWRDL
jgi:hypothetical protein